ncbi:uncharacterized protein [Leptinotarsa decemlineata]|uniref:uncharacterized protein n=1 Tax=Leptinotarsa decemlineata TaxID=7539 RepID=UPI003D303FE1
MGFYQSVGTTYGDMTLKDVKLWSKTKMKLAKEINKKSFLLQCRKFNILPNHMTNTTRSIESLLQRQEVYTNIKEQNYRLGIKVSNIEISSNHKLIQKLEKLLESLKSNIISQTDKSNITVVMEKEQYINLSDEIILNNTSYTELNKDPTTSIQRKCNAFIKELKDSDYIDETIKKKLTCCNGIASRFYALPKIHKHTLSVRPIVASIGAPTEALASLLTSILTKAYDYDKEYYIKYSFEITEKFNYTILPPNYIIASLDVVSLFSNVHLEACLRSIHKNWSSISNHCNIDEETFSKLLTFLFNSTYFSFNNKFYKQTFGTPMGASISLIPAAYVMDDVLDSVLPVLSFKPHFLKKYVDDIIVSLPHDDINEILDTLNSYDPYIQFTIETEDNLQSVPLLDTKFIRTTDNKVLID